MDSCRLNEKVRRRGREGVKRAFFFERGWGALTEANQEKGSRSGASECTINESLGSWEPALLKGHPYQRYSSSTCAEAGRGSHPRRETRAARRGTSRWRHRRGRSGPRRRRSPAARHSRRSAGARALGQDGRGCGKGRGQTKRASRVGGAKGEAEGGWRKCPQGPNVS